MIKTALGALWKIEKTMNVSVACKGETNCDTTRKCKRNMYVGEVEEITRR